MWAAALRGCVGFEHHIDFKFHFQRGLKLLHFGGFNIAEPITVAEVSNVTFNTGSLQESNSANFGSDHKTSRLNLSQS